MERMLCEQCSAVTYSAAARTLIERGQRCPRCGGQLGVADDERPTTLAAELASVDDRSARSTE
jgi:hypothetical protein